MGNELKRQILARSGITTDDESLHSKPAVSQCLRCRYVNTMESKLFFKCGYALTLGESERCKEEVSDEIDALRKFNQKELQVMGAKVTSDIRAILAVVSGLDEADKNSVVTQLVERGLYKPYSTPRHAP